jgi:hypothetical protein
MAVETEAQLRAMARADLECLAIRLQAAGALVRLRAVRDELRRRADLPAPARREALAPAPLPPPPVREAPRRLREAPGGIRLSRRGRITLKLGRDDTESLCRAAYACGMSVDTYVRRALRMLDPGDLSDK